MYLIETMVYMRIGNTRVLRQGGNKAIYCVSTCKMNMFGCTLD